MQAYSLDLRHRVVHAVAAGQSYLEVARRFAIGRSTVHRWVTQQQTTGTVAAKPIPGRPRAIRPADEPALVAQVQAHPDATLAEHCAWWQERAGRSVSVTTMHRAFARLRWPRKKRFSTPASKTP
jgi:transposase